MSKRRLNGFFGHSSRQVFNSLFNEDERVCSTVVVLLVKLLATYGLSQKEVKKSQTASQTPQTASEQPNAALLLPKKFAGTADSQPP
jgi:hypothetical protein